MNRTVLTFVLFQIGWWASLMAGVRHFSLLALPIAILISFVVIRSWSYNFNLLLKVAAFTLIGALIDTILLSLNVMQARSEWPPWPLPTWLLSMWILFVVTTPALYGSWKSKPWYILSLVGAVGGPLSYAAGQSFEILLLREPKLVSLGIIAAVWAIFFPICVKSLSIEPEQKPPATAAI